MVTRGMLHGRTVYAEQGESLRHEIIFCLHCNAKMYIKHLPECPTIFYFATMPGQEHTSPICARELIKNKHIFGRRLSPEKFIEILSIPPYIKQSPESNANAALTSSSRQPATPDPTKVLNIRNLKELIQSGIYDVQPDALTYFDSEHCFIDYIILRKKNWTSQIWSSNELVPIGARVIDARWIGSNEHIPNIYRNIIQLMISEKKIWFVAFWKKDDSYERVRFCLDIAFCFNEVISKLFVSKIRSNDTYNDFVPISGETLDVLVAATWYAMTSAECHANCPTPNKCKNCRGAYWGKCTNSKQIELFPNDEFFKRQK